MYERRRPFHTERLASAIKLLIPKAPKKSSGEREEDYTGLKEDSHIIRSKGFVWLSNSHDQIFYWSHANYSFDIAEEGEWWATIPQEEWPADETQRETILRDFSGKHGDRKQEIVFIGVKMNKDWIVQKLDEALLNDEELLSYDRFNQ